MRWEYCEIDLCVTTKKDNDITLLNRAGRAGWELVLVGPRFKALMRRPAGPNDAPESQDHSAAPAELEGARGNQDHRTGSIAPKYRDPETGETWTGRGKMATWLAERIRAGRTLEDYLIKE